MAGGFASGSAMVLGTHQKTGGKHEGYKYNKYTTKKRI